MPEWLTPVAWLFITAALLSAAAIAFDICVRRHRHDTTAVDLVWIASALYLGPFALTYTRHGRAAARLGPEPATAGAQPTAVAGLPGGGASAVAHLVGVPLVFASGLTIAGINLWVMIIAIGLLAMAVLFVYEFMPPVSQDSFWFLMQIGIVLGLITGYPVVAWLTRRHETLAPA